MSGGHLVGGNGIARIGIGEHERVIGSGLREEVAAFFGINEVLVEVVVVVECNGEVGVKDGNVTGLVIIGFVAKGFIQEVIAVFTQTCASGNDFVYLGSEVTLHLVIGSRFVGTVIGIEDAR